MEMTHLKSSNHGQRVIPNGDFVVFTFGIIYVHLRVDNLLGLNRLKQIVNHEFLFPTLPRRTCRNMIKSINPR